jgi:O-antigen ligase
VATNLRRLISSARANPAIGRAAGITLALLAFAGLAIVGFNLAMMPLGCQVLWGFLATACGTKLGIAGAFVLFVAPVAFVYFVKRPWIFPIALFALLVPSDGYLAVTSGGTLTKFAAILSTGAVLLYLVRERRFVFPGKATVAWIAYFVFASLTLLWAQDIETSTLSLWSTLFQLVLFYVLASVTPIEERDFKFLLGSYIVGCMLASLFGAYVFAHASASGLSNTLNLNQGRLHAHFGSDNKLDSDLFSASFVFPIALMVINILRTRWGLKKVLFGCALAILLIGQFVVGARGGILADCVMGMYLFWKTPYRAQLSFVAISGLLLSLIYPTAVWSRFLTPDETGGSGRLEIWKVGFAALKHYWLYGAGFSNFNYAFDQYFFSVWNSFNPQWHRAPHNIVLEAFVELGIVGLTIMLIAWWNTAKSFSHVGKADPLYDYRIAIEAGVLGTFFAGLFVGIILFKFLWWQFALIALWRQVSLSRPRAGPTEPTIVHLTDEPPPQRVLQGAGRTP